MPTGNLVTLAGIATVNEGRAKAGSVGEESCTLDMQSYFLPGPDAARTLSGSAGP